MQSSCETPPYPCGCIMVMADVLVAGSSHLKILVGHAASASPGKNASGRGQLFSPTEMALTPSLARSGMAARVRPGTSRCEYVARRGSPCKSSSLCVRLMAAWKNPGSYTSGSALWGKACQLRPPVGPILIAAETLARKAGPGQSRVEFAPGHVLTVVPLQWLR